MYLSKVIEDNAIIDRVIGAGADINAKTAAMQFEIPPISLDKRKISTSGIAKTPTARSVMDWTKMIK